MVLGGHPPGRVGRRRILSERRLPARGAFFRFAGTVRPWFPRLAVLRPTPDRGPRRRPAGGRPSGRRAPPRPGVGRLPGPVPVRAGGGRAPGPVAVPAVA